MLDCWDSGPGEASSTIATSVKCRVLPSQITFNSIVQVHGAANADTLLSKHQQQQGPHRIIGLKISPFCLSLLIDTIYLFQIDRSEDEEWKEAMLAYVFINHLKPPFRAQYLARNVEMWLFDEFRVRVCFDVHDALDKLRSMGLISQSRDIVMSCVGFEDAEDVLKGIWSRGYESGSTDSDGSTAK